MQQIKDSITVKNPIIAYIIVFVWAAFSSYLAVRPSPRLMIIFLGLTGLVLLLLPFKYYLYLAVIWGLARNPSYSFVMSINVAGFNFYYMDLLSIVLFASLAVEFFLKKADLKTSPMFWAFMLFNVLWIVQLIRGVNLGYHPNHLRTSARNLIYFFYIFPVAYYLTPKNSINKFVKVLLIGWTFCIFRYFLNYFGIFGASRVNLTWRLLWPPILNSMWFLPFLFLVISLSYKPDIEKHKWVYWAILIVTLASIFSTQTRTLYAIVVASVIPLFFIGVYVQPKNKKYKFFVNGVTLSLGIVLFSILVLRIAMGNDFVILLNSIIERSRAFLAVTREAAFATRIRQMYETVRMLGNNWKNWVFGLGVGVEWKALFSFGFARIDSLYFTILGQIGLLGLAVYFGIVLLWLQRGLYILIHNKYIEDNLVKAFGMTTPIAIIALIINGITSVAHYMTLSHVVLFVFWAMGTESIYLELRKKLKTISV